MEHIFAVRDGTQLKRYQEFVSRIWPKLDSYITFLQEKYGIGELPRVIVWTDAETATKLISDIPVPAYTNEYRVVFSPELNAWREIYLAQLNPLENSPDVERIRSYYNDKLTEDHLLQILGHELTHHIDLFEDGDGESGIWFEEGMAEYISRRYFLTEEAFLHEIEINGLLVKLHSGRYGNHSLEAFGAETYQGDYASIFFEYWRAFLAVNNLAEAFDKDITKIFHFYRQWCDSDRGKTLEEWMKEKRSRQS